MAAEVNVPSDFFPAKSYLIGNIITSTPWFVALELASWDQLLYSHDDTRIRISAINSTLDPVSYAQAISNISDETYFARSMVIDHELLSKTDSDQLFVMDPLTPFSVCSIPAGRQIGLKAYHLSKIWGINISILP